MKLIDGKAPAKRAKAKTKTKLAAVTAISDASVKALALECWRVRKLIPKCQDRQTQFMMQTSVNRMIAALADSGITILDPEGSEFRAGMKLNIAVFDFSDQLQEGQRVVSETLSPHVYINNKLAVMARVIVSVGAKSGPG